MKMSSLNLKWFKPSEFRNCVPPCNMEDCDSSALMMLDNLREICGFPIRLNSCYRSVEYEKKHGRKGTSAHSRGLAFDVACNDSYRRYLLVNYAQLVGFTRIGIHSKFVHLDCDSSLPNPRIWLY